MKKIQKRRKSFLYIGLGILAIAFITKQTGAPAICFWILFFVAILLKTFFLIAVVSAKEFKPRLWLYFILTGVVMILISMLFKTAFFLPFLYKILFYGAISLKVTGLILMIFSKKQ
ncbi:MAG: hypothetical protein LBD80_04275 [Tannerella sp.]|jgi:hypothetical protein|nr:hypothetical protein [Tannerella sp.]